MITALLNLLKWRKPWGLIIGIGVIVTLISGTVYLFSQVQSCGYKKGRAEYQQKVDAASTEQDRLRGQVAERDKEIAALESQKAQYKVLAEAGVKLDAEHAKQIEDITAKEAADLENARKDMDCRDRATNTVALLRTARPPINLDLEAVIRKQCSD